MKLREITPRFLKADLMPALEEESITAKTRRNVLLTLSTMLEDAASSDLIEFNPVRLVKLPPKTSRNTRLPYYLSPDETRRLLDASPMPDKVPIALCVLGGLRRGEVFALRRHDIDPDESLIRVEFELTWLWGMEKDGASWTLEAPKTESSRRMVEASRPCLWRSSKTTCGRLRSPREAFCSTPGPENSH